MTGRPFLASSLLLLLVLPLPAAAQAPPPAAPAHDLSPVEAQRVVDLLKDPQQRAQLIETLQAIAKAAPARPEPPSQPAPAAALKLAPHSLGAQLIGHLSHGADALAAEAATTARTVTDFPMLWYWARGIGADPGERVAVLDALWRAVLVVACALLLERLVWLVMARPIATLAAHAPAAVEAADGAPPEEARDQPTAPTEDDSPPTPEDADAPASPPDGAWPLLRRLPFALARFALDLVAVAVFWGAGSMLAGLHEAPLTQEAIIVVVNAYAIARVVLSIGRMLVSPDIARLRLLHADDAQAAYSMRWLRRVVVVAVFGSAVVDLAVLFGLSESAADTVTRLVALIVAILSAVFVLRCRATIAQRLRAAPAADGGAARWRNGLAAIWHYLALIAIVAGWIVWTAGVSNGIGGLRLLVGSIAIVIAGRIVAIVALGTLDRGFRLSVGGAGDADSISRAARYHPAARLIVAVLVAVATLVALLEFWGADAFDWFSRGSIGGRLVSALLTIAIAAIAAIAVWESANARLERRLARLSAAGTVGHAARLRTLLPILRAALLVTVIAIVGLTALSEIGIDIAPLLAGAGIIGVAVGFGSQKLVQDVITGMFVLFENAIQIGDTATVAGLTGTVEQLSVRNIWLRGGDGALHVIPFSAVTSITNANRGLGNAAVSVTVVPDEDSDRVAQVLKDIAAEMRDDNAFASLMLGDLQIWVDGVRSWGLTLTGQIACTDTGRWTVQREFNRRLQKRFQELDIALSDWPGAQPLPAPAPPASA